MLETLGEHALSVTSAGTARLRLSLPWIRSLPLWCLQRLEVTLDGGPVTARRADDAGQHQWWYIQDRLVVDLDAAVALGQQCLVRVELGLLIPYLQGPGPGPLVLPVVAERTLVVGDSAGVAERTGVGRDVA